MNSIKTPDLKNLTDAQKKEITAQERFSRIGTSGANTGVEFARASKHQDIEIKSKKPDLPPDGAKINEEFTSSRRGKGAASSKRVKEGFTYVGRSRLIKAAVALAILLVFTVLFAPPIFKGSSELSGCRREELFGSHDLIQFRSSLMSEHNVYNIHAVNTDDSGSYRICTIAFDVTNYGPLAVTVGDCIVMSGGEFKDNIVYSCSAAGAYEIPAFSKKTIQVDILINTEGLTSEQLNSAVTTLILSTKGMKKQLFGINIPCIPGFMGVSDELSFNI